jgi:hypothetical protein
MTDISPQAIDTVFDALKAPYIPLSAIRLAGGAIRDAQLEDRAITELLRIRTKAGELTPFKLNAAQRQLSQHWGSRNIVLKARQLGITTYVAARFFIQTITQPGTLSVQVAHDQDSAEEIFRIVHRYLENLPDGLRRALRTSRSNVRQIVFPLLDSEYRVETAADPNAGRGLTIQNLHCSEVARWTGDPADTLASLRAAVPPTGGTVVLESTPNGAAGAFYEEWTKAAETGYQTHFFPWWIEPTYRVHDGRPANNNRTEEEEELVAKHGLTANQIVFRRNLRSNFHGLAVQEFAEDPVSCFRASGECVFPLESIELRLKALAQPAVTRDNGRLTIFFPPQSASDYIVGVDPAGGGIDGDYACAQVIERSTGMQCAELHAHLTPQELASRVATLAHEFNHALVAVERNNHGHAVLAYLDTSEHYPNIYCQGKKVGLSRNGLSKYWPSGNGHSSSDRTGGPLKPAFGLSGEQIGTSGGPLKPASGLSGEQGTATGSPTLVASERDRQRGINRTRNSELGTAFSELGTATVPPGASPGWLTTAASRPRIIERLAAFLSTDAHLFHSRGLLEECRTFVRDETGWAAAASGSHDDRVMAMAIALEIRDLTTGTARKKSMSASR